MNDDMQQLPRGPELYRFILTNLLRALLYTAIILVIFYAFKFYGPQIDQYSSSTGLIKYIEPLQSSPVLIYSIYSASETFFGIIPPEFFVTWSASFTSSPLLYSFMVFVMAVISFIGASITFFIGTKIHKSGLYHKLVQGRWNKYVEMYKKWGSVLIVTSSMTPLPYATISLISASLGFPYLNYVIFASTRFIRFFIYGLIFWHG
jgi:hypothetical protein